ncbi:NACHT-domain-containing protein [Penicillium maclennaniae]|uniref:NACHT-domain-containing protein n=1 Tax=Penicillium maclennaniae TaxID=1343394 RepID=UPI0025412D1D|nr:NACHT-domain-containing protein [Penicillium maclennaniae]KAJ5681613.1 NACHT-domain-containing protein [Penicillium maclennaniae]
MAAPRYLVNFDWRQSRHRPMRFAFQARDKPRQSDINFIEIFSATTNDRCSVPPEQAAPSTTAVLAIRRLTAGASASLPTAVPPTSDTAFHTSSNNISGEAATEISQKATSEKAAGNAEDLATDGSLWDRAYDDLKGEKDKEPNLIDVYEDLLSRVLIGAPSKTPPSPQERDDASDVKNLTPQHDAIARREKLRQITELGLKHMEDKNVSTTLLGHKIVLQDVVANVAGAVGWAEDYIKDAVKDLPYASIIVAGVSLVLPLLKNPPAVEAANQDGFTYVTSQMRYYVAMESLLLPEHMKADLKADLTDRLIDLYKLIIDFQVRSVIRFYRSRTKNFFRGTINYDGWDKKIQNIKENDAALVQKFETAMSGTGLDISRSSLQELRKLAQEASKQRASLSSLIRISQEQLSVLQRIDQHITDPQDQICLQHLRTTNPRDDKDRIEKDKGGLLKDSYRWILDNDDFRHWRKDPKSRLLWVKGDPGKGKTMLLCGIIDELTKSTNTAAVSFFFCQATDVRINNATAVLRGLLYLLVKQQRSLISYVRESYDDSGKQLFEDANAWMALSKIFTNIVNDERLQSTYLVIDALDECTRDLSLLLDLLVQKSSVCPRVKWIVSSRNWPSIEKDLDTATQRVDLRLELNENSVSAAVTIYVRFKVERLAKRNNYSKDTQDAVERYLSVNAHGTFLWVALVCQELATTPGWKAQKKLTVCPPGLDALYGRMMDQICKSEDAALCKDILAILSVVYRPITLDELTALVDMPDGVSGNYEALAEISAKDYLLKQTREEIFPSGIEDIHRTIFSRSLRVMRETLRRDIYNLGAPGFPIDQVTQPNPDPLATARYSCVYWIDHMRDCDPSKNAKDLQDCSLIDSFLRQKYLHWLEALSLLRSMSEGVASMLRLEGLLQAGEEISPLIDRARDASRFIRYHKWAIENSPLQVYASALVFSPARSITRYQFKKEEPEWIIRKPAIADDWSACLQTLEGHSDTVWSVAWSHDAARLASASADKTVKIWDRATGQCLSTLYVGRTPHYLQFDASSFDLLHTERGTFDLRTVVISTVLDPASPNRFSPLAVGYGLSSNHDWITYQGQKLLWLPPEHRASCSAISGTVVSIGCSSGRILILTLLDSNPIS